jgi:outer membrane protein assembly factor BamD
MKKLFLILLMTLALAACGSTKKADDPANYVEKPVEELYNAGLDAFSHQKYTDAAQKFDEVERQHPYSVWATKAELMSAYSYYQGERYTEASLTIDRFIQLNPGHPNIAYAYYLRAIIPYEQIEDTQRDQKMTQQALEYLREVVRRFPETDYGKDAKFKIDLTLDHLAGKEMEIGRFYQKRSAYLSAVNRFRNVVDQYQTTSHVPEALHRLVECYLALGITDQAQDTAAVLGHNFPTSQWYKYSYKLLVPKNAAQNLPEPEDEKGFLGRTIGKIF